jgi:hypothetical protein
MIHGMGVGIPGESIHANIIAIAINRLYPFVSPRRGDIKLANTFTRPSACRDP